MSECQCTFAKKMTGDGCEVCNPAKALEYAKEEIERLRKIEKAVLNLVGVKGRHHAEQAYKALVEVLRNE